MTDSPCVFPSCDASEDEDTGANDASDAHHDEVEGTEALAQCHTTGAVRALQLLGYTGRLKGSLHEELSQSQAPATGAVCWGAAEEAPDGVHHSE